MLTKSEQHLLLELLLKGKIQKEDQNIYKSFKFYNTMSKLKNFGLVECKNKKGNKKIYLLTYPKGWVRANLIAQDKNTPKKYFDVAEEITISPNLRIFG